jgi:hypothetical protein
MKPKIKINNIEVSRKILNSVAHTYDCGVEFVIEDGRLGYKGPEDCAIEIVKQAVGIFERR